MSGWWCTYPSEKWWSESQWEELYIPYMMENKSYVPNHQPDMECSLVFFTHQSMVSYGVIIIDHLISGILFPATMVKLQQPPFVHWNQALWDRDRGKTMEFPRLDQMGKTWDPLGISSDIYTYNGIYNGISVFFSVPCLWRPSFFHKALLRARDSPAWH